MVQFGEKIWFQKIGEEGINSTRKRRIQGIFVGHRDRTRAIPYIAKSGGVRGRSWIRQTLSDAREPMTLEDGFGDLGPMATRSHVMITETKLASRLTNDEPRLEIDEDGHSWRRRNWISDAKKCGRETSRGGA